MRKYDRIKVPIYCMLLAGLLLAVPHHAFAATTGGAWPWDTVVNQLIDEVTGTLAFALGVFAMVGAGAALIIGRGEIGGFIATMLYIVLVIAVIVNAVNVVHMFGGAGAVV